MQTKKIKKVFGAAGTGKTTYIVNDIEKYIAEGKRDFAYITFTKASALDLKRRLVDKLGFSVQTIKDMWIGTQHSLCFRLLGFDCKVVKPKDNHIFCTKFRLPYKIMPSAHTDELGDSSVVDDEQLAGNKFFALDAHLRLIMAEPTTIVVESAFKNEGLELKDFISLQKSWKEYKKENKLVDFTDMLEKVIEKKLTLPVSRVYFDEFQDYGNLQYAVYETWRDAPQVDYVLIAGDDDQAIYTFLGAHPRFLLEEKAEKIILETNYRNPKEIYSVGYELIKRNMYRQDKKITCVSSKTGEVQVLDFTSNGASSFFEFLEENVRTFILTRTNRQYRGISDVLDSYLVPYRKFREQSIWTHNFFSLLSAIKKIETQGADTLLEPHEYIEYFKLLPSSGTLVKGAKTQMLSETTNLSFEDFVKKYFKPKDPSIGKQHSLAEYVQHSRAATCTEAVISKIKSKKQEEVARRYLERKCPVLPNYDIYLGTFHSSKGLEADSVFLVDNMPKAVKEGIDTTDGNEGLEAERRVYYVAMTRAKKKLYFVMNLFNHDSFLDMEGII